VLLVVSGFFVSGCAVLHHVQVGEIESPRDSVLRPFEIKISETGVDVGDIAEKAKWFANSKRQNEQIENLRDLIGLFQMGPKTGSPVFVKDYAKNVIYVLYEKCPSGRITGLTSVRETRDYSVVSGEIVKVTGYCILPRKEG
jgi:hypothetical protein